MGVGPPAVTETCLCDSRQCRGDRRQPGSRSRGTGNAGSLDHEIHSKLAIKQWGLWCTCINIYIYRIYNYIHTYIYIYIRIYTYMATSQNVKPRSIPWTHRPIHTPDRYQKAGDPDRSIRLDHRGPIHTRILKQPQYIYNIYTYG